MNDFKYIHLIRRYYEGDMSIEESDAFEQQLAQNNQLATELREYELLREGIDELQLSEQLGPERRKELTQWADAARQSAASPAPLKVVSIRRWAVAASLAILCVATWWLTRPASRADVHALAQAERLAKPVGQSAYIGNEGLVRRCEQFFNANQPDSILLLLSNVPTDQMSAELLFYKGTAFFDKKMYPQALLCFEPMMKDPNTFAQYRVKAQYWAALCYYAQENQTATADILAYIIQQDYDPEYVAKARLLKEKL